MRKNLRFAFIALGSAFLINTVTQAQDRFAYAITDYNPNTGGWSVLRKLNTKTAEYSDVLLNGMDASQVAFDAITKKPIEPATDARFANMPQTPFATGVAGIAFDKKNNRIYFSPMFTNQLRYVDLRSMKVYYVTDQSLGNASLPYNDESKIITRMVVAGDGNGYAISNDGSSFVRFSTGKNLQIEQLGSLVDDPANTGISIHNRCSSWGGDIVADDAGHLYLFSAHNSVFKIDIETRVATWLGVVKGLPDGFTINGVVVNDEGNLLAGSQGFAKNWVVIDSKTWTATEYKSPNGVYLTSDLANSNILTTASRSNTTEIPTVAERKSPLNSAIQMYPNPVGNNQFNLQFGKLAAGDYTLELTDVTGKQVLAQKLDVGGEGHIQTINLNKNTAKGIYLVKVTDFNSKAVFTQKLVIQ